MKIQLITLRGNEQGYKDNNIKVSTFAKPDSLDMYDINVINLDDSRMWNNNSSNRDSVNCYNDLKNIGIMIEQSKKTKAVIVLPQNYTYNYDYYFSEFHESEELKNMLEEVSHIITKAFVSFSKQKLFYENTETKIDKELVGASFGFSNAFTDEIITESELSDKVTTIVKNKIIYTTLKIENSSELYSFLKVTKLMKEKEKIPVWMNSVKLFDDSLLEGTIDDCRKTIIEQEIQIQHAEEKLDKNNYYKSILYTQGDELVEAVYMILEEMLGFDFSRFKDKKREDFLYESEKHSYIGEIKGVSSNVKSANVSQLDVHYLTYLDENPDKKEKTVAWLIMNHQRTKPVSEREAIHDEQVSIAMRNGSLIIETYVLLKLFEKYKSEKISRDSCLEILTRKTGVLKEKDFE